MIETETAHESHWEMWWFSEYSLIVLDNDSEHGHGRWSWCFASNLLNPGMISCVSCRLNNSMWFFCLHLTVPFVYLRLLPFVVVNVGDCRNGLH